MTFVCIASGPSLTREDVEYCRNKASVIVVNDNYRIAPWADYLWASDYDWWAAISTDCGEPNHALSKRTFAGRRMTLDTSAAEHFGLELRPALPGKGLGDPVIHHGSHSGYAAINLAYLLGARRIVLLGYDLGATGNTHWFGSHPKLRKFHPITKQWFVEDLERTNAANFPEWCKEMEPLTADLKAAGVEVVNCTRTTALTCFERATIEEVL